MSARSAANCASSSASTRSVHPFRVIDTGVRDGRRQIAFDQALIELRKSGAIPDTIRFLRFPPTALIGRHQALSRELRLDYCRGHGIGTVRRITGGGALYFDEGQLGWELVFDRSTLGIASLAELSRSICEAAAAGVSRLGVSARFRPRSDIEVEGRKLGGTGGFFDESTLFYQGTVLVDLDPADMLAALKVPAAGATPRVVTLKELLGEAPAIEKIQDALLAGFAGRLGIAPERGAITQQEEALAAKIHDEEIGTDAFVAQIDDPGAGEGVLSASRAGPGGTVNAYVRLEGPQRDRIREVLITGDFFVVPPRTVYDLEASLRGAPVSEVGATIDRFFAGTKVGLITASPADFRAAIEAAVASGS